MNWSRVKFVLIGILIVLNLFFTYRILGPGIQSQSREIPYEDLVTILENRGVTIDAPIPPVEDNLQYLYMSTPGFDRALVRRELLGQIETKEQADQDETIFQTVNKRLMFLNKQYSAFTFLDNSERSIHKVDLEEPNAVAEYVMETMRSIGVTWHGYDIDRYQLNEPRTVVEIRLIGLYENKHVYDNYVNAVVGYAGIIYMEASNYLIDALEKDKEGRLMDAHRVLLHYFTAFFEGSSIDEIQVGFKKSRLEQDQELVDFQAGLVWRVTINEDLVHYISLSNAQRVR